MELRLKNRERDTPLRRVYVRNFVKFTVLRVPRTFRSPYTDEGETWRGTVDQNRPLSKYRLLALLTILPYTVKVCTFIDASSLKIIARRTMYQQVSQQFSDTRHF